MKPEKLYIDIETYSETDLKKLGVYRYTEDPAFLILMSAWALDDGPISIETDTVDICEIPYLWDPDVLKVAHNAQFERVCFSTLADLGVGNYQDPSQYHDTMAVAGEKGYPRGLDALAKALGAPAKDTAGAALIRLFCKPNRQGRRVLPEERPEQWAEFCRYCVQDVDTLREVDRLLGGWPTETERQVWLSDQRINDRGLPLDVPMVRLAIDAAEENRFSDELEIMNLTGMANPGSNPQFMAWIRSQGLGLPNLQAETVEQALAGDLLSSDQRRVLELRQELALVAAKKYTAALAGVSPDGRLRGQFKFFGAHTGRWSGRGVQPQNLPRQSLPSDTHVDAAILDLHLGLGADSNTLKALCRPMFVGPFTVVDYSAIEARVVAWLAGEQWALDAFAGGRDIYVETASRMSTPGNTLTRFQGKVAVLALGYNGGINSLRVMGASGTDEELQYLVQVWRQANPSIVNLWAEMGQAFRYGDQPVGDKLFIQRDGNTRSIRLPSGRSIVYHDVRRRMVDGRPRMHFADPDKAGGRTDTYGGRLVENVTQAVARDLLAEALVNLHDAGYEIVGHVHDEVIVRGVGTHSVQTVSKLMCENPKWATGLPLDAAGFVCDRYRKG